MGRATTAKRALLALAVPMAIGAGCSFEDYDYLTRCGDGQCASSGDGGADAPVGTDATTPADGATDAPTVSVNITFVQAHADNLGTDDDIAFPKPVTKGSTLIIGINYKIGAGSITELVDSLDNTYQLVDQASRGPGLGTAIYYATNKATGPNTVHFELAASAFEYAELYIHEYTGLAVNGLDQHRFAFGAPNGFESAKSGVVTTTTAPQLLFSFGISGSVEPGTNWSPRSDHNTNVTQDRIVHAIGDYEATGTPNDDWLMMIATFRAL